VGKLWTFGDSYTDFFTPIKNYDLDWRHEYVRWKGYVPKVYGEIIADKIGFSLINKGVGGFGNNHIFEEFCKVCDKIKNDDIVIIGWSNPQRMRLATKHKTWTSFISDSKFKDGFSATKNKFMNDFNFLSEKTIQEILINRESILYWKELSYWIKLINHSNKKIKTIHWSWDETIKEIGYFYLNGYKTIKDETDNEVNDIHWCESSHMEVANYFIEIINSKDYFKQKLL